MIFICGLKLDLMRADPGVSPVQTEQRCSLRTALPVLHPLHCGVPITTSRPYSTGVASSQRDTRRLRVGGGGRINRLAG